MTAKGCAYGVGVGPGDPELMTLKAVRILRAVDVIACSGSSPKESAAYRIAVQAVPELGEKELVPVSVPMTYDQSVQANEHLKSAHQVAGYLEAGRDVAFLILGDPTIYSSFSYFMRILQGEGYRTEIISGIPSFCAVAAKLNTSLIEWQEQMHVVPAAHQKDLADQYPGTTVYMKTGRRLTDLKEQLDPSRFEVYAVQNCGLEGEKLFYGLDEIPDTSDYFTTVIIKERRNNC